MENVIRYGREYFPLLQLPETLLSGLGCTPELPCYPALLQNREKAVQLLLRYSNPQAVAVRQGETLTVWLTLGAQLDETLRACFQSGSFLLACLLNALADRMLFQMDEQTVTLLRQDLSREGCFIGARLEPALDFPLTSAHLAPLRTVAPEAACSTAGSLSPAKSLLFQLLLTPENCQSTGLHDCRRCTQRECPYRGSRRPAAACSPAAHPQ